MDRQLFKSTETGARRSVIFAITVATGALCLAAAASAVVSGTNLLVGVLLGAFGAGVLVFGGSLQRGYFDSLFDDQQVFWRLD